MRGDFFSPYNTTALQLPSNCPEVGAQPARCENNIIMLGAKTAATYLFGHGDGLRKKADLFRRRRRRKRK